jgi:hypothetical protein
MNPTAMTTDELRKLDQWIGVNVFGKIAIHRDEPNPANGAEGGFFVIEYIHISNTLPHYTTDPAAAFEVLKKCAGKGQVYISTDCIEGWAVADESKSTLATAATLELAIARFAFQLHGGKDT